MRMAADFVVKWIAHAMDGTREADITYTESAS
jgi:hypothetical protein